jgi:hypothetical protein
MKVFVKVPRTHYLRASERDGNAEVTSLLRGLFDRVMLLNWVHCQKLSTVLSEDSPNVLLRIDSLAVYVVVQF